MATGQVGATGPTGPIGLRAFGQINTKRADVTVPIAAGVPEPAPLTDKGAHSDNVDLTESKTIKTGDAGYYFVSYTLDMSLTALQPADLTFAVRSNKVNMPQTVSTAQLPIGTYNASYIGSSIELLPANAVIDVVVDSSSDISMSFEANTICSLILYQLN